MVRIFILLILIFSSSANALTQEESNLDSFNISICEVNAKFLSNYAYWIGHARAIANNEIKAHPLDKDKIESQYQLLKSKSQDAAFKQLRSTLNTKDNGIANRLIRSIQDLVMNNAEDLGEFYPDMSEAYYYKRLEEACDSNIKEMKRMQP